MRTSFNTMMQLWHYTDAPDHLKALVGGGSWVLVVPRHVDVPSWFRSTARQEVKAFAVGDSDTCYIAVPVAAEALNNG